MSYKIAVATTDEIHVDQTFGAASGFVIYEVENGTARKSEYREYVPSAETQTAGEPVRCGGNGKGCGCGGGGNADTHEAKSALVSDCRCIVCTKIGMHVQKNLQLKAISAFDVQCTVAEALDKLTAYYHKIDKN